MDPSEVELQEWCQELGRVEDVRDVGWQPVLVKDASGREKMFVAGRDAQGQLTAIDALKGIEGLLRRDAVESQPLHLRLGEWQTIRTSLLPLLIESPRLKADMDEVFYRCLKVLVRLTLPLPALLEQRHVRLEHLQQAKACILEGDALQVFLFLFTRPLAVVAEERNDHERNIVELGLTLIRNVLAVPDPINEPNEYLRKLHDRCIVRMWEKDVIETLCVLASDVSADTETSVKFLLQECFAHLFRQEKHVEDLFEGGVGEGFGAGAEGTEGVKEEEPKQEEGATGTEHTSQPHTHAAKPKSPSNPSSSSRPPAVSSFVMSEAARLTANLNATLAAERLTETSMAKTGLARHSRFASKYSMRVVDPLASASSAASATPGNPADAKLFASRFVRNPFGRANASRMVSDSLAARHGRKPLPDVVERPGGRSYLNFKVRQALYDSTVLFLDSGGFNTLSRHMLGELARSPVKDLGNSQDARMFMEFNKYAMAFQRVRSKTRVRAAEKIQRAEEKEQEEREAKIKREEVEARKAMEPPASESTPVDAAALPSPARMAQLPSPGREGTPNAPSLALDSPMLSEELPTGSGSAYAAPLFPNAPGAHGALTIDSQPAATAAQPPVRSSAAHAWPFGPDLDDGENEVDMTVDQAAAQVNGAPHAAAAAASSSAVATPAVAEPKPFIRRVCFDPRPVSAGVSFDTWKFLVGRIRAYTEERPLPWTHLHAAVSMYTELLRHVYEMHSYGDVSSRLKADTLRRSLFYDRESLELFSSLLVDFKVSQAPLTYLSDLVTATHYQMALLEDLARGTTFHVLEKRRRVVKRKKPVRVKDIRNKEEAAKLKVGAEEEKEGQAQEEGEEEEREPGAPDSSSAAASAAAEMARVRAQKKKKQQQREQALAAEEEEDEGQKRSTLFPVLSEEKEAEEEEDVEGAEDEGEAEYIPGGSPRRPKLSALEKAKRALDASKAASAQSFSAMQETGGEDELAEEAAAAAAAEKEEGEGAASEQQQQCIVDNPEGDAAAADEEGGESEYEDVEVEEDHLRVARRESEFNFGQFLARFAHPHIVANYLELLGSYRTIPSSLVQMILLFFRRLCAAHLGAFFFQLSAFCLFERILTDEFVKSRRDFDELRRWIKEEVVRKFLDLVTKKREVRVDERGAVVGEGGEEAEAAAASASTHTRVEYPHRHLFVELLFWKSMSTADRLLNEEGWFDRSKDRARSARDAQELSDGEGEGGYGWVEVDEEEEEARLEARAQEEQEKLGGEAELVPDEWVDKADGTVVRGKVRPWTPEEDAQLRKNWNEFAKDDEQSGLDIIKSLTPLRSEGQIKDRLRKLGLIVTQKRKIKETHSSGGGASPKRAPSGKKGKSTRKSSAPTVTLAEILDRHAMYTRVPPIDDVMNECRDLVVALVQRDSRAALGQILAQWKLERDRRAQLEAESQQSEDGSAPSSAVSAWDFTAAPGEDHGALELLGKLFKIMGIRDQDDKDDAWTLPAHFTSNDLDEYITMLESTLDSSYARAPREQDVEDDEAISRLLSSQHGSRRRRVEEQEEEAVQEEEAEEEQKQPAAVVVEEPKDAEAEARKAAKRARREAKQMKEVMELSAAAAAVIGSAPPSQSQSLDSPDGSSGTGLARPRRRRQDEIVAERMRRDLHAAEERRAREAAADEEAEAEYVPSSETALGAAAVDAARAAEAQLTSSFAKKDLNDFMAQKRKRFTEAVKERAASQAATQFMAAAAAAEESPPKKRRTSMKQDATPKATPSSTAPAKRRLRRATQESDEEEPPVAPSQLSFAEADDDAPSASAASPAPAADDDEAMPAAAVDAEEDEDASPAPAAAAAKKKKHAARRRIQSDEDDEDAGGEDGTGSGSQQQEGSASPMELDEDAQPAAAAAVDTQAATQVEVA